jgi:dGTPase
MLASYAVRVEDSLGRRHPEPEHPYRNPFQRDRDRIIHARAFRRLESKTQVFIGGSGARARIALSDHFRNRLTHTIEVAQISRTIAAQLGLNVDLVEALALVHDIGHPPFGHAGEKALDAAMRTHESFFDHNLHALRIVEDFEQRYAEFRGLNLTFELREGIIKHSRDYCSAEHPELAEYLLEQRPPLEAQLIDLTDEIAYNTADLDDGYESRILNVELIRSEVRIFDGFYDEVQQRWPKAPRKLQFNEALKRMIDRMVTDLIENTACRVREAGVKTPAEVRACPQRLVAFSEEVEAERAETKAFLYKHLYYSPQLLPEKDLAERVIGSLFQFWMEHPEALPYGYREKVKGEDESLPRIVCDYIAGMTDHYILEQYKKLCGE